MAGRPRWHRRIRSHRCPGVRAGAVSGGVRKRLRSGALIRCLLANALADEMTLLIVSEVIGQGAELVPDAGPDVALDLVVESRADAKGVTIPVYRPSPARAVWR